MFIHIRANEHVRPHAVADALRGRCETIADALSTPRGFLAARRTLAGQRLTLRGRAAVEYIQNPVFRNHVRSLVANWKTDLAVRVPPTLTLRPEGEGGDLGALNGVFSLSLAHNLSVVDVDALDDVRELDLSSCSNLQHVNGLRGSTVHTLDLSNCFRLSSVAALGGVRELRLRTCLNVHDVTELAHAERLDLSFCKAICDVQCLHRVPHLNLSYTSVCNVAALGNAKSLGLRCCTNVCDVSALGRVAWLDLSYTGVLDVSALDQVAWLDLRYATCGAGRNLHTIMGSHPDAVFEVGDIGRRSAVFLRKNKGAKVVVL